MCSLRSLTSWLTFLRTKDRLLRTHYTPCGLLYLCNTSGRSVYDQMLVNTLVLSKLNYSLDIFHETKLLMHRMTKNIKHSKRNHHGGSLMKRSYSDERPKKSPSGATTSNLPKSKTMNLHKSSGKIDQMKGEQKVDKFKKLQLQWEMLASRSEDKKVTSPVGCVGSKIPRPISAVPQQYPTQYATTTTTPNVRPSSAFFRK
jgi:hypothetical protein